MKAQHRPLHQSSDTPINRAFSDFSKGGLGDAEYLRNGQCSLLLMGKSRGKVVFTRILNVERVRTIYKPRQCLYKRRRGLYKRRRGLYKRRRGLYKH